MSKLFLLTDVTSRIMLLISDKYNSAAKIRKHLNVTYAYLHKTIVLLEEEEVIQREQRKRERQIILTPKGKQIQKHLLEIKKLINGKK